ncbi:MAG: hypothetical protein ACYC25_13395, partial [Paludibacter sp.]
IIVPCPVRNSLEHALGIKTIKTLNPGKTNIQQDTDCCVAYNQAEFAKEKYLNKNLQIIFFALLTNSPSNFLLDGPVSFNFITQENKNKRDIPFYILYKRFKYLI